VRNDFSVGLEIIFIENVHIDPIEEASPTILRPLGGKVFVDGKTFQRALEYSNL
jgi:hypothetical protein